MHDLIIDSWHWGVAFLGASLAILAVSRFVRWTRNQRRLREQWRIFPGGD